MLNSGKQRLLGRLAAYSGALTAVAGTAEASIVHTSLDANGVTVANGIFDLDLNHDGTPDFALLHEAAHSTQTDSSGYITRFTTRMAIVQGADGNNALANPPGWAFHLRAGDPIDPTVTSALNRAVLASYLGVSSWSGFDYFSDGAFIGRPRGYLGLQFTFPSGGRHSAWADVEVLGEFRTVDSIRVYGYAFETEPGKPILAGDTGVSPNFPGDTNGDGKVDLVDLNNVRNNFGASGDGIPGDTNDDGLVDLEDLNAVRNNFGAGNPVPEPPSLLLLAAGAAGLGVWRRRHAKHEQS